MHTLAIPRFEENVKLLLVMLFSAVLNFAQDSIDTEHRKLKCQIMRMRELLVILTVHSAHNIMYVTKDQAIVVI